MRRSALVAVIVIAVLGTIAFLFWNRPARREYRKVVSSLAAFDSLAINCPNIHKVMSESLEKRGAAKPCSVTGLFPGFESSGRVVGKTPDGRDEIAVADGAVNLRIRPASQTFAGRLSPGGESIAASVIGLSVDYSQLDDRLLKKICEITTLEAIGIENSQITPQGLEYLANLPSLTIVFFGQGNANLPEEQVQGFTSRHPQYRVVRDAREYNRHVYQLR